jgi:hypothetical protein
LRVSHSLLPCKQDIADLPLSMTTENIGQKIQSLSVCLQLYLDQFLFRIHAKVIGLSLKSARDDLHGIVDRIVSLIAHLPCNPIHYAYDMKTNSNNSSSTAFLDFRDVEPRGLKESETPRPRDTAIALLYAFARLLKHWLGFTTDSDEATVDAIRRSAIAICRLCASLPDQTSRISRLLMKRSLFWAGLVLTESRFPSGQIPVLIVIDNSSACLDKRKDSTMHSRRSPLAGVGSRARRRGPWRNVPEGGQFAYEGCLVGLGAECLIVYVQRDLSAMVFQYLPGQVRE